MTVQGAEQFIKEASKPVLEITHNIEELEAELKKLRSALDTSDNQFTMEAVKKNKSIQADIQLTEDVLNKAKKRKEQMIIENSDDNYKKAREIMAQYKRDMNEKHKEENIKMIEAIEATRQAFAEMKEQDREYHAELMQFIDEVKPYLDPNDRANFGAAGTQYQSLFDSIMSPNRQTYMTVLNAVQEGMFDIDGLIKEPKETQKSRMEKEKYGLI